MTQVPDGGLGMGTINNQLRPIKDDITLPPQAKVNLNRSTFINISIGLSTPITRPLQVERSQNFLLRHDPQLPSPVLVE